MFNARLSFPTVLRRAAVDPRASACVTIVALLSNCSRPEQQPGDHSRPNTTSSVTREVSVTSSSQALTELPVESASIGSERTDLALTGRPSPVNPDSEHVALDSIARQLWQSPQLRIQSETIAITVVHPLAAPGATERNTYFYYRSRTKLP